MWREQESYTGFSLFSDIGGTMGLLLGYSVLSLWSMFEDGVLLAMARAHRVLCGRRDGK